jgi:hypothetical protein
MALPAGSGRVTSLYLVLRPRQPKFFNAVET